MGDFNGDGFNDLAVVSGTTFDPQRDVRLHLGGAAGVNQEPAWLFSPEEYVDAAAAGDLNGDGFDDLVVEHTFGEDPPGSRFLLFFGGTNGLVQEPIFAFDMFGFEGSIAFANIDCTGGDEIVVLGAEPRMRSERYRRAAAYPYRWNGLNETLEPLAPLVASEVTTAHSHYPSMRLGDINGDGCEDIVVIGLGDVTGAHVLLARASVFLGGPGGPSTVPSWTAGNGENGMVTPIDARPLGDLDEDGFGDVLFFANDEMSTDGDMLMVYRGTPSGLANHADWTVDFGEGVSGYGSLTTGDFNGDGRVDLATVTLTPDGPVGRSIYLAEGDDPPGPFGGKQADFPLGGFPVAAGDVNGDGCDDVVVQETWPADERVTIHSGGEP